jgi:ribosome assembly protein RRB1
MCVFADSDEESDNDDLDDDPILEHVNINHQGGVNRLRSMPQVCCVFVWSLWLRCVVTLCVCAEHLQNPGVIATMAETRHLNIFDAAACYRSLLSSNGSVVREPAPSKPVYVFSGHRDEGADWPPGHRRLRG